MSSPEYFTSPLSKETLRRLTDETFGDMVKFVVDIEERTICVGGGLHSDEEAVMLEKGSRQQNLWGANYYPDLPGDDRFEYNSMINVRPSDDNHKQDIQSEVIRQKVRQLAIHFFESKT
jgi:hypothetical protein